PATFDVSLPNLVASAGSKTVVPMAVFTSAVKNPFAPATRKLPIYFPYPNSEDDEVNLTIPAGLTVASLPAPAKMDSGALNFNSETKRKEGVVTLKRNASY